MSMNFRLPGPTPLPPPVIAALGREMIPHRGPAFRALFRETLEMARQAHRTDGDVLIWPASGSAGWEVAVVNLLSPGDPVLAVSNGNFGERFARVAARLGLDVRRLEAPWGEPVLPEDLGAALERHSDVKAVFLVHNETSTGVTNPLQELAAVVRNHGALVLVDSVSGVGALPLETDAWGIDFVMSGSQKAWMCPPGLLIVAAGSRAWDAYSRSEYARFFWDMGDARAAARQGTTPTTAPLSLIFAYHAALQMIFAEGLEDVWERHRRLGELTRQGIVAMELELFARRGFQSDSVTAFRPPAGVTAGALLTVMRDDFGVEGQTGQGEFSESLIRLGHMGWVDDAAMLAALEAVAGASARLADGMPDSTGGTSSAARSVAD